MPLTSGFDVDRLHDALELRTVLRRAGGVVPREDNQPVAGDVDDVHRIGATRESAAIAISQIGTWRWPEAENAVRAGRRVKVGRHGEFETLCWKSTDSDTRRR